MPRCSASCTRCSQGYCLGAISAAFNAQTEGIVSAAVLATVSVFVVALFLYVTRIVRPTQKMAFAVSAGLGGLILLYVFVSIVSIFNWTWLYSDQFRTIGIVVSLIAIVLAALSLTLDFGTIEAGVEAGAPEVHGVVLRLRPDGHADLAVHHVAATARVCSREIAERLSGRSP